MNGTTPLERLRRKYLWWESSGERGFDEDRLIAQIMDIGDFHDVESVRKDVGDERFRAVLARAQPGWFSQRSWTFWHYRLGLTAFDDDVPAIRRRMFR